MIFITLDVETKFIHLFFFCHLHLQGYNCNKLGNFKGIII